MKPKSLVLQKDQQKSQIFSLGELEKRKEKKKSNY